MYKKTKMFTVIAILCGLLAMAGCSSQAPDPELIFNVFTETHDPAEGEVTFELSEFTDLEFMRDGVQFYVKRNGQWDQIIINAEKVIAADLNSDGKREFVYSTSVGSGYVDNRIYVYDIVNDMQYCLARRMENDFDIVLVDGKLVAQRFEFEGVFMKKDPIDTGELQIKRGQLFYIYGDEKVQGSVENAHFNMEYLQKATAEIQDYISRDFWFTIYYGDATNYYMDCRKDIFQPAILERREEFLDLDASLVTDMDALQYLELINRVTHPYDNAFLFGFPERYVYIDPEKPNQLFICSELRDTKYDDIRSYYEALKTGKSKVHVDTYVMRLDENAIYRWGESENLYESLRNS